MARYGYARISTRSQRDDSQLDALRAAGCERNWTDTASGKLARRPEWDNWLDHLRRGDELVVTRLSRMARSVRHLTEIAALLEERGIDLVVLNQGIDTTTAAGRFTFHVLAAMDEMLAGLISEGTREGPGMVRARGRAGGRKPKLTARQAEVARGMYDETGADGRRKYTVAEIAETVGVSRKTVYRHLEPCGGRRQPGKSARPAAPAESLATLPHPIHARISAPAARARTRPAAARVPWPARPAGANLPPGTRQCSNARTSPSSGCSSTVTASLKPGTGWYASRTGPSSTSAAPAAATAPDHRAATRTRRPARRASAGLDALPRLATSPPTAMPRRSQIAASIKSRDAQDPVPILVTGRVQVRVSLPAVRVTSAGPVGRGSASNTRCTGRSSAPPVRIPRSAARAAGRGDPGRTRADQLRWPAGSATWAG